MHLRAAAEFDFGRCQLTTAPTSTMTVAVSALSWGDARPLAPDFCGAVFNSAPGVSSEPLAAIASSLERSFYVRHLADRRGGAVVDDQGTGPAVHRSSEVLPQEARELRRQVRAISGETPARCSGAVVNLGGLKGTITSNPRTGSYLLDEKNAGTAPLARALVRWDVTRL